MVINKSQVLFKNLRRFVLEVGFLLALDFAEVVLVPFVKDVVLEANRVVFLTTNFIEVVHIKLNLSTSYLSHEGFELPVPEIPRQEFVSGFLQILDDYFSLVLIPIYNMVVRLNHI